MILKGNQRGNGRNLAHHLMNVEDNEHVVIHELRGFMANNLLDAFVETEAISLGTKCEQYLFSLSLNPPPSENVCIDEFEKAISDIERRLGLVDQPRAIVFHEKLGLGGFRRHAHCVWSRINVDEMRGINLPFFKTRLMDLSREIYLEKGWEMPIGLRDHNDRDPLNYSHEEAGQAKRIKRDPAELKRLFKNCWETSDSLSSFTAALREHGFCLARGDRRGYVAVDAQGEIYSLSRWCGVKPKTLRSRLGDNLRLPDVDEALDILKNAQQEPVPVYSTPSKKQIEFDLKLSELIEQQRRERQNLRESQEKRHAEEIRKRQAQLPKGMKAVWSRITGRYRDILSVLAKDAESCKVRDRHETQGLIDRHLAERRALDLERLYLQAQIELEREFHEKPSFNDRQVYKPDPRQHLIVAKEDVPFTLEQLKQQPDLILMHISEKKASFTKTDIVKGLSNFITEPLDLRIAADKVFKSAELVRLQDSETEEYTTRDFLTHQRQFMERSAELMNSGGFSVDDKHIKKAIADENASLNKRFGANLSLEQVNAIHHILKPNQMSCVVGFAGSGKSTLLSVAKAAWERQGLKVHGATLAGKAADSLQAASGIESRTLASLEASWKSGYEPVECGDIVVIDEAGMVGTRQMARVTEQLQLRGCKLVLIGDPDQLQPIEAGMPFKDIVEDKDAAYLRDIRRQSSRWQREASRDLAEGRTDMAWQIYDDQGAIHHNEDRDQAIANLVDDYMADWKEYGADKSRLALAHRRVDVHAINQAIKAAQLEQKGSITETLFDTDNGPRSFGEGDRILFTRNDATLNVRNGMLGTVKSVSDKTLTVEIDSDETGKSRMITFSPKKFASIDHGFAVSIHRSQGCTVDRSFVLESRTLDKNLTYVALTRHRKETGIYTAPDIESVKLDIERKRPTPNQRPTPLPSRSR